METASARLVSAAAPLLRLLFGVASASAALSYMVDANASVATSRVCVILLALAVVSSAYSAYRDRAALGRLGARFLSIAFVIVFLGAAIVRAAFLSCPDPPATRRYNALQDAITSHDLAAAEAILAYDDQPDYVPPPPPSCNSDQGCYYQQRPLVLAIDNGDIPIAKLLLDHGAKPAKTSRLLEIPAYNGDVAMLEFLIQRGVPVNDGDGNSTALWFAVGADKPDALACLLAHDANPNTRHEYAGATANDGKESAIQLAQSRRYADLADKLFGAGAQE